MIYRIVVTPTALGQLAAVSDRRVQGKIRDRINRLARDPEQQGKPLTGELAEFRSVRAVGQRYRIIYRVERSTVVVSVVGIGLRREGDRKDVYALAKKLFRLRLI